MSSTITGPVRPQALLLAADAELPEELSVWGTGGWRPPRQREALDWLMLMRMCGWSVRVVRQAQPPPAIAPARELRWGVVGCPPEEVSAARVEEIDRLLAVQPVALVMRSPPADCALARLAGVASAPGTREVNGASWHGPDPARGWHFEGTVAVHDTVVAGDVQTWARGADATRLVMARRAGRGAVITLAFHPGEARDVSGGVTSLLRHVLVGAAQAPVAWVDWSGTMVLRMDDPGSSQNVFCARWCYPELGAGEWREIGAELARRNAQLSVAYSAGWVDDGDPERGELRLNGKAAQRAAGRVHPSSSVWYRDLRGHRPGAVSDYAGQHRALCELRDSGEVEVELHGYTHMYPAPGVWARAPDRYEAVHWYRELGVNASAAIAAAGSERHPLALGIRALAEQFGVHPTTLVCPGDQWTNPVLEYALGLGIELVSSHYLALRDSNRFCWSTYVCAPYLDEPDSRWFDAGLPVVGYFHDRDLVVHGTSWLRRCLDAWQEAGARRWIDLAELAAILSGTLSLEADSALLRADPAGLCALPRRKPLAVNLRFPDSDVPDRLEVWSGGQPRELDVERLGRHEGRVVLPRFPAGIGESDRIRGGNRIGF